MDSPKRQPKNSVQYLVDEYILFRRDFVYEVDVSPNHLAELLQSSHKNINTFWLLDGRIVSNVYNQDNVWHFELVLESRSRGGGYSQSYRASGYIFENENKRTTQIEGTSICEWYLWLVILIVLGGLSAFVILLPFLTGSSFNLSAIPLCLGTSLLIVTIFWFSMFSSRNHLLKLIQNAVESAHEYPDKAKTS